MQAASQPSFDTIGCAKIKNPFLSSHLFVWGIQKFTIFRSFSIPPSSPRAETISFLRDSWSVTKSFPFSGATMMKLFSSLFPFSPASTQFLIMVTSLLKMMSSSRIDYNKSHSLTCSPHPRPVSSERQIEGDQTSVESQVFADNKDCCSGIDVASPSSASRVCAFWIDSMRVVCRNKHGAWLA